jgi:hypothetical protein
MNSKKAFSLPPWFMIVLVLSLVFIVIFMVFISSAGDQYKNKAYNDICNNWIRYAIFGSTLNLNLNSDESPCHSQDITITGKQKMDIITEVLDKKVACYNSYFRGESEIFKPDNNLNKYCAVCYKLNFTEKDIIFSGLDYLLAQEMRKNRVESYIDIFAPKDFSEKYFRKEGYKNDFIKSNSIALNKEAINTSNEYLVVFTYHKAKPGILDRVLNRILLPDLDAYYFIEDYIGFINYHNAKDYTEGIFLVEFKSENLVALECQTIVGIQQPGITTS